MLDQQKVALSYASKVSVVVGLKFKTKFRFDVSIYIVSKLAVTDALNISFGEMVYSFFVIKFNVIMFNNCNCEESVDFLQNNYSILAIIKQPFQP